VVAVTHVGGAGPAIHEKRAMAPRRCLNCDKVFVTSASVRLCKTCVVRAAQLAGGLDAVNWRLAAFGGRRV
jgi:hypothetical protein